MEENKKPEEKTNSIRRKKTNINMPVSGSVPTPLIMPILPIAEIPHPGNDALPKFPRKKFSVVPVSEKRLIPAHPSVKKFPEDGASVVKLSVRILPVVRA